MKSQFMEQLIKMLLSLVYLRLLGPSEKHQSWHHKIF